LVDGEFIAIIFIQPFIRPYPNESTPILIDAIHLAVGQPVGRGKMSELEIRRSRYGAMGLDGKRLADYQETEGEKSKPSFGEMFTQ